MSRTLFGDIASVAEFYFDCKLSPLKAESRERYSLDMQNRQHPSARKELKLKSSGVLISPHENSRCQIMIKKGFLTAKNITSDVVLLLYSLEFQLGVLLPLPLFSNDQASETSGEERAYMQSAMAMILNEFRTLGVKKRELLVYAVGGAEAGETVATSDLAVKSALWAHSLALSASDLGGNQARSVWMDVETGRIIIRSERILKQVKTLEPLRAAS